MYLFSCINQVVSGPLQDIADTLLSNGPEAVSTRQADVLPENGQL